MYFILGIAIAFVSIVAAIFHLGQNAAYFWDFVAFITVFGGTIAVFVMITPWQYKKMLMQAFGRLLNFTNTKDFDYLSECVEFIKTQQQNTGSYVSKTKGIAGETLQDAAEMLSLNMSHIKVKEILEERILQDFERWQKIANSLRSLSKYPPAFGLAGTVLGLVTLMRKVSEGLDSKQTGVMMAIALMATFYGLLVSNLLVNPAGEYILKIAQSEQKKAEIGLQSVILLMEKSNLLEAQEVLNSLVTKEDRISVISSEANT